jgi:uncharacterized protein (DUF488 family)
LVDREPELPLAPAPPRGDTPPAGSALILTIGHSTRTLEELIALLRAHRVERLVDVRAYPRSRRHPQFNSDTLPASLAAAGIDYGHLPALGGKREGRPDSKNIGWREPAFRAYADHMDTAVFAGGLAALLAAAARQRVAIMCAEAHPSHCHRSLISDALVARAVPVEHIVGPGPRQPHRPPPFARLADGRVTYPALLTP